MGVRGSGRRFGPQDVWAGLTMLVLLFGGLTVFAYLQPPLEYRCDNSNYPTFPCRFNRPQPAPTTRCPTDWWEYRSLDREAAVGCAMTRPTPLPCPTTPHTYWVAQGEEALPPGCSYPRTATVPPSTSPLPQG
ncbi:hypothetical protein ACIRPK_35280 [Kitasatospora sp. NPDC101801]|uniref:hypothetical protein n=1 Tax=Kitasatospora sp. NPDC101801 TaxID=3364103 RepID=UPI00380E4E77